ncbi:hypothetical protein DL240_17825 [Lujinxingia litoralis]|uniref:RCC1-like domain-containing protein n=1 Tax=Lujinxingia litoralis TaxID=2211119 RepID=A0A328C5E2_9DELT|nr:hypothetical protein DL240_17825 [Lujinxingia litoralis]
MLITMTGLGCNGDDSPEDRDAGPTDTERPDGEEPDGDVPDGEEPDGDVPGDELRLSVEAVDDPVFIDGEEGEVTLNFSCAPAGCTTTCQLNELDAEACAQSYTVRVNEGRHDVAIRASYQGEEVEERVSFRVVGAFELSVSAPPAGDVFVVDQGQVSATCEGRPECVLSCEICTEGSCQALEGCETGASLVLNAEETELVVRACVDVDGEDFCQEERRDYVLVAPRWEQLSLGETHGCAVLADDTLWCWGNNGDRQLGSASPERSIFPLQVPGAWASVSAGRAHTCALKPEGTLWCWGQQRFGRLGNGEVGAGTLVEPVQVTQESDWDEVSSGDAHTCGRRGTEIYCWGYNPGGRLGVGLTSGTVPDPTLVVGGHSWKQVSSGHEHICGLTEDDQAYCWGRGDDGRLGNGALGNLDVPTAVIQPEGATFVRLEGGFQHTCAVMETSRGRRVFCWGTGSTGRLGTGASGPDLVLAPEEVGGDVPLVSVSSGNVHSCGLNSDGEAWCWGYNDHGQLGVVQTGNELVPVEVDVDETFLQIEAGKIHTCAITTAGVILCWGENGDSELGREIEGSETHIPGPLSWPYGLEAL